MAFERCPKCGFVHYLTDPCPSASTKRTLPSPGRVGSPSPAPRKGKPDEPNGETARSLRPAQAGSVGGAGPDTTKKRGRPRTGFNRRDYQREYMRKRRAKLKAEKGKPDA